jgi:hypothetical protein
LNQLPNDRKRRRRTGKTDRRGKMQHQIDRIECRTAPARTATWALSIGLTVLAAVPEFAVAADFYKGKTLTVMIASRPGGGTDTTARLVARYWGNHIPGKPQVLIRNKPLQAAGANDLQTQVRPDGLTVGVFAGGGTLGPALRKSSAVRYDLKAWEYVGSIDRGPSVQLIRKSALERLTNPKLPPVAHGSVSTDRTQDSVAAFGAIYLGWNLKFVLGYPNSNAIYLAYGRGEIDMFGSGTDKILDRFIKQEGAAPLVVEKPRSDYPGAPVFEDLLKKKGLTKEQWAAYRQWTGSNAIDKFFALPPKTPAGPRDILRTSFNATAANPTFKKDADNILGDGYVPIDGEKTRQLIVDAIDQNPEGVKVVKAMRAKLGLPQIKVETAPDLVKVKLDEVQREGRVLVFKSKGKNLKVRVSGSRTEITVGGKVSPREAVKTGMTCEVGWTKRGDRLEAQKIVCP